jgi:hypothetical protein
MNHSAPGWSCPICNATHHYDCPNLGPVAFLQAVLADSSVPIRDRMRAADILLRLKAKGIHSDPVQPEPAYKVIIPPLMVN